MVDYWVGSPGEEDIEIISPAIVGYEGRRAPICPFGGCTFLTEKGLCELHELGLKPTEGRLATCKGSCEGLHEAVAQSWDNKESQIFAKEWLLSQEEKL